MPGFKGHIIFGILFFIILIIIDYYLINIISAPTWWWWLVYSPLLIIMSLMPDLDTPASKARWLWTVVGLCLIIFLSIYMAVKGISYWYLSYIIFTAILLLIPWFLTHRGIAHSFVAGIIIAIPLFLIGNWQLYIFGVLAYWSHLLIDFIMTFIDRGHVQIRFL